MKFLPCLCFLLLGIIASTFAQRVENASYDYEQQHFGLLKARYPSSETEYRSDQENAAHAFVKYRERGHQLWATLSKELTATTPDEPHDSAMIHQTWDFTYVQHSPPPMELIGPLRNLHLPVGNVYTSVFAKTPKHVPIQHTVTNFDALYDVVSGVIIVEDMYREKPSIDDLPDGTAIGKEHWSQITAECWRELSQSMVTAPNHSHAPAHNAFANLRYVFMHLIISPYATEPVINEILMVHKKTHIGLPARYLPNTDTFNVLLGSPNGQGVAYMLYQNKNAFQRKTIKSVTLQSISPGWTGQIWWHLWWEIG
ncbi:hypothetical protein MMC18_003590 [Xylographa bjoerkii]|nr:hypothetical protein [Xylographa bjoerkii]